MSRRSSKIYKRKRVNSLAILGIKRTKFRLENTQIKDFFLGEVGLEKFNNIVYSFTFIFELTLNITNVTNNKELTLLKTYILVSEQMCVWGVGT